MESILTTVKKMVGLDEAYTAFDLDIIVLINTYLLTLNELGVGPEKPATITSSAETWKSVFGDIEELSAVKSYISYKVRLAFDPPTGSSHLQALTNIVNELEWRLTNHTIKEG